MLRGFVIFLLVMGVVVQTLPLRACALEQAVAGRSCHERDGTGVEHDEAPLIADNGLHGHAATDGESDRNCRCEMPKAGVDRHVPADAPVDLLPAQAKSLDVSLALVSAVIVPALEQPPSVAANAVSLPLLN
jgi:hypothetical protein